MEPTDYVLRAGSPRRPAWIKSARLGGVDVLHAPISIGADPQAALEIELSSGVGTIVAEVSDAGGRPVSGVLVVAIRESPPRGVWAGVPPTGSTDVDGRAHIEGLAPGTYTLFATSDVPAEEWQDPAVVRSQQGRGVAVRVEERGRHTVNLRLIP